MIAGSIEIQLLASVARLQKDMDAATKSVGNAMTSIDKSVSMAKQALGSLGVAFSAKELLNYADTYSTLRARIALFSKTAEDAAAVQAQLTSLSERQRVSLESTVSLYAGAAAASRELGASQADIMKFTEGVSAALTVNGTTAQAASGALLQLSQAIGGSKIQAQEFNSLIDGARPLLQAVANNLDGASGSVSKLTQMVKSGEVSSRDFFNAAVKGSDELIASAGKIPTTFGQAVQVASDRVMQLVGRLDQATGASNTLGKSLISFAGSSVLKTIFETIAVLGLNIAYVFKQVGNEIGGIAAQAVAIARLDFKGAGFIREQMVADAKAARIEVDRLSEAILNPKVSNSPITQEFNKIAPAADIAASAVKKVAKAVIENNTWAIELAKANADLLTKSMELNAVQGTQADALQLLVDKYTNLDPAVRAYAESQILLYKDNEFEKKIYEQNAALDAQVESINASVKAVDDEVMAFGKLPSQITDVTIARLNDKKAMLESLGLVVPEIAAQIEAYERLKQAQSGKEFQEAESKRQEERVKAYEDANKKILEDQQRMADTFSKSLTDAIFRGFESGKGFIQNFKDTLINSFKTLVLKPVIEFLVNSSGITKVLSAIGGLVSGSAVAGTDVSAGPPGIIAQGKNLYQAVTIGFEKANIAFEQTIQKFGSFLVDKGFDNLGGMISQYSATISKVLPYAGAAFSLIKGDIKGAALQGAGVAIGSYFGGPIGGAIGSAIGSAISGLIGGGKKSYPNATFDTSYTNGVVANTNIRNNSRGPIASDTANGLTDVYKAFGSRVSTLLEAFDLSSLQTYRTDIKQGKNLQASFSGAISSGGSFGFDGWTQNYGPSGPEAMTKFINDILTKGLVRAFQASSLSAGIKGLFNSLTTTDQIDKMITSVVNLKGAQEQLTKAFSITVDQSAQVANATGLAGDALVTFIDSMVTAANGLKTSGDILVENRKALEAAFGTTLPATLVDYDNALKAIDKTSQAGIVAFMKLFAIRDDFATFTGQIDTLKNGVKSAIYDFLPDDQKLASQYAEVKKLFDTYGLAVPKSSAELIALADSIDYTTAAGIDLANVFPSLVAAFNATQTSGNELIAKFKGYADDLKAFGKSLTTGPNALLSPEGSYNSAKAEYDRISALANTGDASALAAFTSTAQAFLDASKDYFASSNGYFADLEKVKSGTGTAEISALAKADVFTVTGMASAVATGNNNVVQELQAQNALLTQTVVELKALVATQVASNVNTRDQLTELTSATQTAANQATLAAAS